VSRRSVLLRTASLAAVSALAWATTAAPALAHEAGPRDADPVPVDATYVASGNVEFVGRFPEHSGSAGGRLLDGRFYISDPRGVTIYDVADPAAPVKLGSVPLFQLGTGAALGQEDPDTNGQILLVDGVDPNLPSASASLQVVDVSDPTSPAIIGSVAVTDHTWTCVQDCTYAYGRTGHVVDLTNPANPTLTNVNWRAVTEVGSGPYTHDFTEVADGLLFSAGQPSYLLDITDPLAPILLTQVESSFSSLGFHGIEWAHDATDGIVVLGTEIGAGPADLVGGDCQGQGVLRTFDADAVVVELANRTPGSSRGLRAEFEELDTWRVPGTGAFVDGYSPAGSLYCSHWFNLHPQFDAGGLMTVGYYDWGTRFIEVAPDGVMEEIGWFLPVDGYTASSYWISDDIVYSVDYRRGLEILRFIDGPSGEVVFGEARPAPASSGVPAAPVDSAAPGLPATGGGAATFALGMVGVALGLRRRQVRQLVASR